MKAIARTQLQGMDMNGHEKEMKDIGNERTGNEKKRKKMKAIALQGK